MDETSAKGASRERRYWQRFGPLAAVVGVLAVAGFRREAIPEAFEQQDKLHHLLGFLALGLSMRWAWRGLRLAGYLLPGVTAAALIELGQGLFLPHRTASLADAAAGVLGVLVAWWLWGLAQRRAEGPGLDDPTSMD